MNTQGVNDVFARFVDANVLVIGDVMIDCYIMGKVNRISPEAPVPIVNVQERIYRLGGAANVALNLKSLGAHPILCSVIGKDEKTDHFMQLMRDNDLESVGILSVDDRKTTIKYRIIGNNNQIVRVDDETEQQLPTDETERFYALVKQLIETRSVQAIVLEDYDKGLFSKKLITEIVTMARNNGIFVSVDPKKRHFNDYDSVNLFKPNLKELTVGLEFEESKELSLEDIHTLSKRFAETKGIDYMMITMSAKGVAFYDRKNDSFYHQDAFKRKISDVSGAGDTVISVATLCMTNGLSVEETCLMANLAGGIVCESLGVVPIDCTVLKNEFVNKSNV